MKQVDTEYPTFELERHRMLKELAQLAELVYEYKATAEELEVRLSESETARAASEERYRHVNADRVKFRNKLSERDLILVKHKEKINALKLEVADMRSNLLWRICSYVSRPFRRR